MAFKNVCFLVLVLAAVSFKSSLSFAETGPGAARAMNPDIGANFLTWYRKSTTKVGDGVALQESEFSLKSDVDPYLTANAIFSIAPKDLGSSEFKIEPEEIYVDSTFIRGITLRAGKFYGFFGKQNILHTHAFPFIDAPLVNQALLGDGLNDAGISASALLPTDFFSELSVQGLGNFKSLAHLRALIDVNDDSTLEFGASGVTKWAWGADLTFKHRPTDRGQGRRFNVGLEWMSGSLDGYTVKPTNSGAPVQGYTAYSQYEFLAHTYAQYRFEELLSSSLNRNGVLLAYAPSEFSAFRLQYDYANNGTTTHEHRILAQMNITIGFHPPHDY